MKKIFIACAVILAGILSSCGDTNYCYKVTTTLNIEGLSITNENYVWGTSNELDAVIDELEAEMAEEGISKDFYKIDYKRANKSESDCY